MATFIKLSASLFCLFFSILSHQTMSQPQHMHTFCDEQLSGNFTQTSSYGSNRESVLSYLRDHSSLGTYSNATFGLSPDTVHGMFLCRGDISKTSCSECVKTASEEITKNGCAYNKNAIVYYLQECMVRYSNVSFFGLVEMVPASTIYSNAYFPNSLILPFRDTLSNKVEQLIVLTASKYSLASATPYYTRDVNQVSDYNAGTYTLETMVQCSLDLDPANCAACLRLTLRVGSHCCDHARFAHIFLPKCYLKYDTTGPPHSGSSSINVMKGKEIFKRLLITAMIGTFVLILVGL